MQQDDIDVMSLAIQAKQIGYDDIDRVVARLKSIIARNTDYLEYRARRRLHGAYNEIVREDTLAIAAAGEHTVKSCLGDASQHRF